MKELRNIVENYKGAFVLSWPFLFWESSAVMLDQTLLNLAFALLACVGVSVMLLPSLLMCVLAFVMVDLVLVGTLASMVYVLDVSIDNITMIVLVAAVGFAVDNVGHYCHAFVAGDGLSRLDRSVAALVRVGPPIIMGDFTTILAMLPLRLSDSKIFHTFFNLSFVVLLLGIVHSCVLLPVIMATIGPSGTLYADPVVVQGDVDLCFHRVGLDKLRGKEAQSDINATSDLRDQECESPSSCSSKSK